MATEQGERAARIMAATAEAAPELKPPGGDAGDGEAPGADRVSPGRATPREDEACRGEGRSAPQPLNGVVWAMGSQRAEENK